LSRSSCGHEFALRAFKLNSIDRLLKPIDVEHVEQAISKFKERLQKEKVTIGFLRDKKCCLNPFEKNLNNDL
jgi:YesN/AraC family two-component response regulator